MNLFKIFIAATRLTVPKQENTKLPAVLLNVIDSFLNTIHLNIGKFLKGATSVRGLVEPLLWNPGYCDAKSTLPLYPLYDDENPAPKEVFEKKEFNDPVKKEQKRPARIVNSNSYCNTSSCNCCGHCGTHCLGSNCDYSRNRRFGNAWVIFLKNILQ